METLLAPDVTVEHANSDVTRRYWITMDGDVTNWVVIPRIACPKCGLPVEVHTIAPLAQGWMHVDRSICVRASDGFLDQYPRGHR